MGENGEEEDIDGLDRGDLIDGKVFEQAHVDDYNEEVVDC